MIDKLTIAIAGATGRMGQVLINAPSINQHVSLAALGVRPGNKKARENLFTQFGTDVVLADNPEKLAASADAVIDFTSPEATLAVAKAVAKKGGIHIIGTTGFSDAQQKEIARLASKARIVQSGNFSLGVNVLEKLVAEAAKLLDERYDIEIFEMHHKHKKDAPSGTALMLGRAAAAGRGIALDKKKTLDRDGLRKPGDIGFSVARGGDVVGIHSVLFAGPGEVIEMKHQGFFRDIYAHGALEAALWARSQKPGLYSMQDVLASL